MSATTPSSLKRTRFSDVLTSSPTYSPVPRKSILKNSPHKSPTSPVKRHRESLLSGPPVSQLQGMSLLSAVYSCSIDLNTVPSLDAFTGIVVSALTSMADDRVEHNPIVIYGSFYIKLRSCKFPASSLQLIAKGESLLRFARRDLLKAEALAKTDSLATKQICLIVRCVDYLMFVREIAEKLDTTLVTWFFTHALQALGDPSSPKVSLKLNIYNCVF